MSPTLALALAAALSAAPAANDDQVFEYFIDESIPLPADGVASLSIQAGPVTITQVRIRNAPTKRDLRENPTGHDRSHPKPAVTGQSSDDVNLQIVVSLEDDAGNSFMSCRRKVGLDEGDSDEINLCTTESMYTHDWPSLRILHLSARVILRDPATGSPADAAGPLGEGHAVLLHYHRPDGRYRGGELQAWEAVPGTVRLPDKLNREPLLPPTGQDDFGVYWVLKDTNFRDGRVTYIIRRRDPILDVGDEKEQFGEDKSWLLADSHQAWVNSLQPAVYLTKEEALAAQRK